MANDLIDRQKVKKEMDVLINMITHPAFVDAMKKMKASPVSKRRELGKKLLNIDVLKAQGVEIPPGMRLTTRYFEPGRTEVLELGPDGLIRGVKIPKFSVGDLKELGNVAWGGCACGGGLSFCGGAGGST